MHAMLLRRPAPVEQRPLEHTELVDPRPASGEILIRVEACGVCRTDLHVVERDDTPSGPASFAAPCAPRADFAGRLGKNVKSLAEVLRHAFC